MISPPPRPPSCGVTPLTPPPPLSPCSRKISAPTSYGFVLPNNPYGGLDYWVRVPPTDPGFQWKQALLDGHPLTATGQSYDFSGTVRAGGMCCIVLCLLLLILTLAHYHEIQSPWSRNQAHTQTHTHINVVRLILSN